MKTSANMEISYPEAPPSLSSRLNPECGHLHLYSCLSSTRQEGIIESGDGTIGVVYIHGSADSSPGGTAADSCIALARGVPSSGAASVMMLSTMVSGPCLEWGSPPGEVCSPPLPRKHSW